jgi:hypothetical protein
MKSVLLIYQGPTPTIPGTDRWDGLSEEEKQRIYTEYAAVNQTPGLSGGLPLGLPRTAKTVRVKNGEVEVTNGTYQREAAGGYAVYDAEDLEAAIALAARIPAARLGGAVEVRPAEKYW